MFILYQHNKSVQHIRQAQQIAVSSILRCISITLLFQAGYCFTIELLCTCSTLLFWHAMILSCCACKAPHFVILQLGLVLNFIFYCFHLLLERNCYILTLRFHIVDCLLSVHESHDFAYCKHYQYFILSPKYRLLHAFSHICPDIISRLQYLPRCVSQGQIWAEGWYQGRWGRHGIGM